MNSNTRVPLEIRYDVVDRGILRETVTTPGGRAVDETPSTG
jgi:hypothetical protein